MASKIAMIVSRLSKSNAPIVINRQMSTLKPSVKAKMELFGLEDATPVFQKSGAFDGITYRFTMGACVASLGLIGATMFRFAFKK